MLKESYPCQEPIEGLTFICNASETKQLSEWQPVLHVKLGEKFQCYTSITKVQIICLFGLEIILDQVLFSHRASRWILLSIGATLIRSLSRAWGIPVWIQWSCLLLGPTRHMENSTSLQHALTFTGLLDLVMQIILKCLHIPLTNTRNFLIWIYSRGYFILIN